MALRLANHQQALKQQKTPLQLAREKSYINCEELKDLLFGQGNFNKYVKPYNEYVDQNRHIFSHHNI